MEKLANHIALQNIAEGGMEKQAYTLPVAAVLGGVGAAGAALGSEDHKILSGILGAGAGAGSGYLGHVLSLTAMKKLENLAAKVKNPKLQMALQGLVPITYLAGKTAVPAGAGYGTGKLVDWIADKIG